MSRKISIGWKYGELIRINNSKEPDHVNLDDQQDSKKEEEEVPESSLPPQIDSKKKKLLILNLNGFLIRKIHILDYFRCVFLPNRVADYRFLDTILFKRPFSQEFMRFCLQRFEVAIWSSAVEKNVRGALTCAIGGDLVDKLLFVWDQSHCNNTGYKSMENAQKPLFLKVLEHVWNQYPSYSASNTLLIDDKPYRTIHNPVNTAIFIESYDLENEMDNFLDPNGALCEYLNGVAEAENVQEYVEHYRFGLPPITPEHRDWDLFMLISYSTFGTLVKVKDMREEENVNDEGSEDELELNLPVENNINAEVEPKEKKLLIMNLNGFLMRRINLAEWESHPSTRVPDYLYRNFLLFKRPYSKEFMRFCLERFEVGVWTSARGHNLDGALTCCIGGLTNKLLFVWDQNSCWDTGFRALESLGKHLYIKEIHRVWGSIDNGRRYSCANTLVIDDKPYRAVRNPMHTTIFTQPYDIDDEEDNLLDPEGELCRYLNGVAEAEDAGEYVQQHPFGLPGITPTHPEWEYYAAFRLAYHGNGFH
ncbi:unnamed protein product [Vicia faba]|uniref:Mitochondrial import inner membrane translocase subunit TIM50 n=1 Tax=Vicia faba TaxID=3906 RepID=A0AAV1B024_VICFA|nr:unnamed protein product [Vicia faba]